MGGLADRFPRLVLKLSRPFARWHDGLDQPVQHGCFDHPKAEWPREGRLRKSSSGPEMPERPSSTSSLTASLKSQRISTFVEAGITP